MTWWLVDKLNQVCLFGATTKMCADGGTQWMELGNTGLMMQTSGLGPFVQNIHVYFQCLADCGWKQLLHDRTENKYKPLSEAWSCQAGPTTPVHYRGWRLKCWTSSWTLSEKTLQQGTGDVAPISASSPASRTHWAGPTPARHGA
jgi:hypothetical protein